MIPALKSIVTTTKSVRTPLPGRSLREITYADVTVKNRLSAVPTTVMKIVIP